MARGFKRIVSKHVYYLGWNRSPAQVGCMTQALGPGALGRPGGSGWRGRWEGGSGWGTHVNPWLFHFNVWQNSLQKKKKKNEFGDHIHNKISIFVNSSFSSPSLKKFQLDTKEKKQKQGNCQTMWWPKSTSSAAQLPEFTSLPFTSRSWHIVSPQWILPIILVSYSATE